MPEKYPREENLKLDPNVEYFTVAQAAEYLGINVQSTRNAAVHGNLTSISLYGRVLIPRAALEEYKQRTQPDGRPPAPGRRKKAG